MTRKILQTLELPINSSADLSFSHHMYSEEDDEDGNPIFLYSTFGFITDDYIAYFGQSNSKTYDMTADEIKDCLEPLPDDDIYPEIPTSGVTTFSGRVDDTVFLKRPMINDFFKGTGQTSKLMLQEVLIMELILQNPHPNIVHYQGCLTMCGRIVGLVLDRHNVTLQQVCDGDTTALFDVESFMTQITSAVTHLHSLGVAHNDLKPMNIMVDDKMETLVLIDFGSCQPFGSPLISAGTVGWIDEEFTISAKVHDEIALGKLRSWLLDRNEQ